MAGIVALFYAAFIVSVLTSHNDGLYWFIQPGHLFAKEWADELPVRSDWGYDGQFAYYIARDPLGAVPHIDNPLYRYHRVLLPVLARVLAAEQIQAIPFALLFINVSSVVGATFVVATTLRLWGRAAWPSLLYGLSIANLAGVSRDLSEPLAYALAAVAVWAIVTHRNRIGLLMLALMPFAREVALLCALPVARSASALRWRLLLLIVPVGLAGSYHLLLSALLPGAMESLAPYPLGGLLSVPQITFDVIAGVLTSIGPAIVLLPLAVRPALRGDLPARLVVLNCLLVLFLPQRSIVDIIATIRNTSGVVLGVALAGDWLPSRVKWLCALLWIVPSLLALAKPSLGQPWWPLSEFGEVLSQFGLR